MTEVRKMKSWIWAFASALLLFVVAAHAVTPVPAQHGHERGSAFSASTEDVSLRSGDRAAVTKALVGLAPPTPPFAEPVLFLGVSTDPVRHTPAETLLDPRLPDAAVHPISARAPPLA